MGYALLVVDIVFMIKLLTTPCSAMKLGLLYSGKFLLVQIFMKLRSRPSEEIFVVLNFVRALEQATPTINDLVLANCAHARRYVEIFGVLVFAAANYPRKPQNFAPCKNFLLYGTT